MTLPYSTVILLTDPGARITGGVGPDTISSTAMGGQGHPFEIIMHPEFL
jgi:hypothetical protein